MTALETVRVEMKTDERPPAFVEVPGTEKIYPADLVLLAMGFVGPEQKGLLEQFGVELDRMGNVKADADKRTSVAKVFTAGDMTRGQSLIVWAIAEGRHAAQAIDEFLMGRSDLPRPLDFGNHLHRSLEAPRARTPPRWTGPRRAPGVRPRGVWQGRQSTPGAGRGRRGLVVAMGPAGAPSELEPEPGDLAGGRAAEPAGVGREPGRG